MIKELNKYLDKNNEFHYLVDLLNENIKLETNKIIILEKVVIITLVTKLETFLENKTSEWFENLKKDKFNTSFNLSLLTKKEIVKNTIDKIYNELKNGTISPKNKNKIKNFNILLDDFYPLENLDIEFKITLNSHGSNEIKNLLKKIGIDNIFELMEQLDESAIDDELIEGITLTTKLDYEGNINKLINYRNNIIHEDTLNSISYSDLNEFITNVNLLGKAVNYYIDNIFNNQNKIRNQITTTPNY